MSVILFVCTGNLCRSPMATGLLRQKLAEKGLDRQYQVRSAGVWADDGRPASENAVEVMAERGIDIGDHIAHSLTAEDLAEADLVLVMGQEHAQVLRTTWPQYAWKVWRLGEMSGRRKDVVDPYLEPIEQYRACAAVLADYIDRGLPRILDLA